MIKNKSRIVMFVCGLFFLAAAGTSLVLFSTTRAVADEGTGPSQQGWWTTLNPGPPAPAPPAPPDVPSGGLLVQGGGNGPTSYAGLVYQLPPGATPTTLTLDVTQGSASTPSTTLEICTLDSQSLNPDQGGPMSDAPAFSCAQSTSAPPSAGGGSYQFSVGSLASSGVLSIAILPTGPTDRVVFDKPGDQSLAVSATATSGDFAPPQSFSDQTGTSTSVRSGSSGTALGGTATPIPVSTGAGLSGIIPSSSPGPALAPTQVGAPSPATPSAGHSSLLPQSLAAASPSTGEDSPQPLAVGFAIAGVIAAVLLWGGASRTATRQRPGARAAGES